jgi:DNA polymerase III epsilon subunit-like protein
MYFIILDTETTNTVEEPLMYDLGFSVIDETGKAYESFSFVIADVFLDKELMQSAYFADKIPMYWDDIKSGKRELKTLYNVRKAVVETMRKYGITYVIAHNARFDVLSTKLTQRYITKSKWRYFFPFGTQYIDTLKMARAVYSEDEKYCAFCVENGYTTKHGQNRYTAEILYRFISGDNSFEESHTGFEDTEIEKIIFAECAKKMDYADGLLW